MPEPISAAERVLPIDELMRLRSRWRDAGLRIVLTNGTFDLLHIGHVRYLETARAQGDLLVVGINSDSSVRLNKGPGRPVVPQDERAEIVASLRCVDYAVIFEEKTAEKLVELVRPDVYVKGGDYGDGGKDLPEAPVVEAYGGEVRIVPFVEGHSASDLIRRANRS